MLTFQTFINENLDKFTKLNHLEHAEDLPIEAGEHGYHHVVDALKNVHKKLQGKFNETRITTKFDGCLHENTLLYTEDLESGIICYKTIKEINEEWFLGKKLCVLGFHEETDQTVKTLILDKLAITGNIDKEWIKLEFGDCELILTSDHKVKTTNRGWVSSGELVEGDDIQEC
jgi:hypothetical protein